MVIHDSEQQQQWVEQERLRRQRKPRAEQRKSRGRLSVLAVQCVSCCCLLLLVLLFRLVGGEGYTALRQSFHQAMQGNEWMAALVSLWDGDPEEVLSDAESTDKDDNFTPSSALKNQGSSDWTLPNRYV